MWKFLGPIKKEVEFLGVIKKKSCGISMGLGFGLGISKESVPRGKALFYPEFPRLK